MKTVQQPKQHKRKLCVNGVMPFPANFSEGFAKQIEKRFSTPENNLQKKIAPQQNP